MKTRDEILGSVALPFRVLNLREWGETKVTMLTALEKDRFETGWKKLKDKRGQPQEDHSGFRAYTAMYCVVDDSGARVFQDDDFDALCNQPADIMSEVFDVGCELNKLTKEDREALVKN